MWMNETVKMTKGVMRSLKFYQQLSLDHWSLSALSRSLKFISALSITEVYYQLSLDHWSLSALSRSLKFISSLSITEVYQLFLSLLKFIDLSDLIGGEASERGSLFETRDPLRERETKKTPKEGESKIRERIVRTYSRRFFFVYIYTTCVVTIINNYPTSKRWEWSDLGRT